MRTTKDGFVWLVVSPDVAKIILKEELFELCALYDDDTEVEIECEVQLLNFISLGHEIAIPVGQISEV